MKQHTASELIFKSDLSTRARIVFMYLSYRSNKENTCFPSIKTIARECGMAVSTVKRALGDLDLSGYIKKDSRYREDNGQTSNLYTLVEQPQVDAESEIKVSPMESVEGNESDNSEAIIAEVQNSNWKSQEQTSGIQSAAVVPPRQNGPRVLMPLNNPKGGVHFPLYSQYARDPMTMSRPTICSPLNYTERGEPPPGSYP